MGLKPVFISLAMVLAATAQRKECLSSHREGATVSIRTKVRWVIALGLNIMETLLSNFTTSSEGREKRDILAIPQLEHLLSVKGKRKLLGRAATN